MVSSRFTFHAWCQPIIPLTSTSSSDLMDAIALSDVLMAKSAYSSELSQSMSVELRSVVLRYSNTSFSVTLSKSAQKSTAVVPQISRLLLRGLASALKDQSWYSEWFPVYFVNALKAPHSVTEFLKSSTKRWRRIRRICPQLLDHDFSHSDLFLLSLSMSLQGRHPCFQSEILSMNCWYCCCVKLTAAMVVTTTLPHTMFSDWEAPLP